MPSFYAPPSNGSSFDCISWRTPQSPFSTRPKEQNTLAVPWLRFACMRFYDTVDIFDIGRGGRGGGGVTRFFVSFVSFVSLFSPSRALVRCRGAHEGSERGSALARRLADASPELHYPEDSPCSDVGPTHSAPDQIVFSSHRAGLRARSRCCSTSSRDDSRARPRSS